MEIPKDKFLWQLTVEEFIEINQQIQKGNNYVYGLNGLAKILGCSRSKASQLKSSGILDDAITQNGNIILIEKDKVIELLKANSKK